MLAAAAKLAVALARLAGASAAVLTLVDGAGTIGLLIVLGHLVYRVGVLAKRRLLWRVRRKLILSYIFMGVVPALLIGAFFVLGGLLVFLNVAQFLVMNGVRSLTNEAQFIADSAALEIHRGAGVAGAEAVLSRKRANAKPWSAAISMALVPASIRSTVAPVAVGPWRHLAPPESVPEWVSRRGWAGLLAYAPAGRADETEVVIRAVGFGDDPKAGYAVVIDLPVDEDIARRMQEETSIELGSISVVNAEGDAVRPAVGAASEGTPSLVRRSVGTGSSKYRFNWVVFFDYADWLTGRTGRGNMAIVVTIGDIYERLSAGQARIGNRNAGQLFLILLAVIGVLFLIIEIVALIMGLALARSITGSVHELFTGTERVRHGDFTHKITIGTRDQLGELADSFNSMAASIEDLLREAAEKKRLEEELRIARAIQMSLLPRDPLTMPGLSVTALCVPAREVGGDYYDFLPLDEYRVGILIADVSGKGTSAALYMAELKGLVLSLSQVYRSPRELLAAANRIITANIDTRSFITMTYAVIDTKARTMTCARAGHTPTIHVTSRAGARQARVLAPEGLVLGLQIEGMASRFEEILEEVTVPLEPDDVLLFFTDGVTEAMNHEMELFGESRLARLAEEHGHLPTDALRERILREVDGFVDGAAQHDDMTMVLIKVEDVGPEPGYASAAVAAV